MQAPDEPLVEPALTAPEHDDRYRGDRLARRILTPLVAAFAAMLLMYAFFDFGRVDGPSMLPTLHDADRVLLTKGYTRPQRGDIIFTSVLEKGQPVEIVKRVIGLPGDTVEVKDDIAFVNGVREPDVGQIIEPRFADSFAPYVVPAGYLFVMGDNRPVSNDSRYIGAVPVDGVMGRVVAIYAPITRVRGIH